MVESYLHGLSYTICPRHGGVELLRTNPFGVAPSNLFGGGWIAGNSPPPNKFEGATRFALLFLCQFPAKRVRSSKNKTLPFIHKCFWYKRLPRSPRLPRKDTAIVVSQVTCAAGPGLAMTGWQTFVSSGREITEQTWQCNFDQYPQGPSRFA